MKSPKALATAGILFFGLILCLYALSEKDGKREETGPAKQGAPHAGPHAPTQTQPRASHGIAPPQRTEQAAPQQQQHRPQKPIPAAEQRAMQRSQQAQLPQSVVGGNPPHERSESEARSWQTQRGWAKQGAWQAHTNFQQGRDKNWVADHRDWTQRGGYGGVNIPQASFRLHFGSTHSFRIGAAPVMYMGYPRFAYGGYSFMLLDPWPDYWQEDWYASDDVYIDYSDGYYLHDRSHPGVKLAVTVAL